MLIARKRKRTAKCRKCKRRYEIPKEIEFGFSKCVFCKKGWVYYGITNHGIMMLEREKYDDSIHINWDQDKGVPLK
jgi:hypothetical protein